MEPINDDYASRNKTHGHEGLKQAIKAFSVLSGVGIYFVIFVGICIFIGDQVDQLCGWRLAGKLTGIIVGFPGAIYTLYRQLKSGHIV